MRVKTYKLRRLGLETEKTGTVDFNLEFEGERAYVVWDTITLGKFELKARVEIDPNLLQDAARPDCDFFYRGELVLPRAENN
jgi:hypothetical protein